MRIKTIITNFTAGEISPLLMGRVDFSKYFNSAEELENFIVSPYGGIIKVPGTRFVTEVKDSAKRVRLIPFQFSNEQAYILEFGEGYIRFYMDGGIIMDGASPYEISNPYSEDELFDIHFAQSYDVLYLCHPNHPVMKLSRYGHTNWTLTEVDFKWGPFMPDNDTSTTITPSGTTGNITLTASSNIFDSGHVGALWRIQTGYVRITSYTSPTQVSAQVIEPLPSTSATTDWAEGAFSAYRGYPRAITFYEQRLFLAGTNAQPQTVWGSVPIDYENFHAGPEDDDAVSYTIASEQANIIMWLIGGRVLSIGTTGGVFSMSSGSSASALTPSSVVVHRETTYGASSVRPVKIGNIVYYVQRNGWTVREFFYSFEVDSFIAEDATLLAEHVTRPSVVEVAYQQSPYNLLWVVRSDGVIAVLSRLATQQVMGWSRILTDGQFESVAVIPNGAEDQVWVVVKRNVNGQDRRYVEYFVPFDFGEQEDAFFVHSGLDYDGAETDSVSGLDHLIGKTVAVLTDGAVHPEVVVQSDGSITLQWPASRIIAGLPYQARVKTVPIEIPGGETLQGRVKRIVSVVVRLYRSLGLRVGLGNALEEVNFREGSTPMDEPPSLFTGDKRVSFRHGTDYKGQIELVSTGALPLVVLAVMPEIEIGG